MLSKLLVITSIAFAINAAVVDPSAHTVQYESAPDKLVTEHYEIASEADTSSSRVINTNPHINSFRHRCNFQCNDSNGNYMTGRSDRPESRQRANVIQEFNKVCQIRPAFLLVATVVIGHTETAATAVSLEITSEILVE